MRDRPIRLEPSGDSDFYLTERKRPKLKYLSLRFSKAADIVARSIPVTSYRAKRKLLEIVQELEIQRNQSASLLRILRERDRVTQESLTQSDP